MGSAELAKVLLGCGGFGGRKVEVVRRWGRTMKRSPKQSHAGPWPLHVGNVAFFVLLWYRQGNGWK